PALSSAQRPARPTIGRSSPRRCGSDRGSPLHGGGRICLGSPPGRYGSGGHGARTAGAGGAAGGRTGGTRRHLCRTGPQSGTGAKRLPRKLTAKDALTAHARDELGIVEHLAANPSQAAWTSAATFAVGAAVPLAAAVLKPTGILRWVTMGVTAVALAVLG